MTNFYSYLFFLLLSSSFTIASDSDESIHELFPFYSSDEQCLSSSDQEGLDLERLKIFFDFDNFDPETEFDLELLHPLIAEEESSDEIDKPVSKKRKKKSPKKSKRAKKKRKVSKGDVATAGFGKKKLPKNFLYKCDICEKGFAKSHGLCVHRTMHNKQIKYENCPYGCMKSKFARKGVLAHLEEVHNYVPGFDCADCDKTFETRKLLKAHAVSHINEKNYKCPVRGCDKAYKERKNLNHHINVKHQKLARTDTPKKVAPKQKIPCTEKGCERTFANKSELNRHINRRHTLNFFCDIENCEAGFIDKAELAQHKLVDHSPEKAFPCAVCGLSYDTKKELDAHVDTRHREKTIECDQCGATFPRPSKLQRHLLVHSNEKPFKCFIADCNEGFKKQASLDSHVRRDHKDYLYKCDECVQEFVERSLLKTHKEKDHKKVPTCVCGEKFDYPSKLKRHQQRYKCSKK